VRRFKDDLGVLDVPSIVQKHISFGDCHALEPDQHFALKAAVAKQMSVHHSEVLVVGSGKLGFSIAPNKRYRHFGDTSDVDVAVASPALFERVWRDLFDYDRAGGDWPDKEDFTRYLFRGWARPDKLPPDQSFQFGSDWWEFFRSLTASGDYGEYRITGAIYQSWWFLERYQEIAVTECERAEAGEAT
jgi:hypothetical protein